MSSNPKDLFDESTMSFGEHLEVLRIHLWKAIIGLVICVTFSLFFGDKIILIIRGPIDRALVGYAVTDDLKKGYSFEEAWKDFQAYFPAIFGVDEAAAEEAAKKAAVEAEAEEVDPSKIKVTIRAEELAKALREAEIHLGIDEADADKTVRLTIQAPEFANIERLLTNSRQTVALNVQEAFLTYLKVAFVSGFVIASPWIFYQVWLFVAAGLYPHERRYVYFYLPLSLTLFAVGAVFCFYAVFPFVLDFLLGFNKMMGVQPQIRLSEWISFAIMLPVMFGLSFQLPLVMLFMERISIFEAKDYRERRRMAILIISIVSMLMTPADPMSMVMMMIPLIVLYELGIFMCSVRSTAKTPFEAEPA